MSEFEDFDFDVEALAYNFVTSNPPTPEPESEPEPEKYEPNFAPSDEEVDELFDDLTSGIENDEEVIAAAAAVLEAEYVITQIEIKHEEQKQKYNELDAKRREIEKLLNEVVREQDEVRRQLNNMQWDKRRAETAHREKQHAVEVARQAALAKKRFDNLHKVFERKARGKAWYEGLPNGKKILAHQWVGAKFLASAERAILGDGMGLGKTLTSIAALDLVDSKRALVVCPADITSNFVREVQQWAPHRPVISIKGMTKNERNITLEGLQYLDTVVIVVNYEAWRKDFSLLERLIDQRFDTVILDEAHSIKATASDTYKGCDKIVLADNICPRCPDQPTLKFITQQMRICPSCNWQGQHFDAYNEQGETLTDSERYWLTKSVKHLWTMTGTPILNAPQDIYAMLSLIDPHNFYAKNSFLREYCYLDENGRWSFRTGGLESLTTRLSGRYLARNLGDTDIVLPEQTPIVHEVTLDPDLHGDQIRVIKQLKEYCQIVLDSGATVTPLATIALITRQRQANVWPGGIEVTLNERTFKVSEEITQSAKIEKATELIAQFVEAGQRVALFSQFSTALEELHRRLDGSITEEGVVIRSVRLDGSTPENLKEEIKTNFNKDLGETPKWDVVLCNYKTGGVGLNLTNAEHTIILDEEWNPGKRDQAYARTHRIGQDRQTFVHLLRIPGTIDTWLSNLIEQKEKLIEGFDAGTLDIQAELRKALSTGEL